MPRPHPPPEPALLSPNSLQLSAASARSKPSGIISNLRGAISAYRNIGSAVSHVSTSKSAKMGSMMSVSVAA